MTGGWRALLRLMAVQGTWNYERMLGVGMGYAAEPLLEDLKTVDPVRHGEAVVRSAEFFNCNPNLAGLALGATVRAEYEAVPGAQIARLRTGFVTGMRVGSAISSSWIPRAVARIGPVAGAAIGLAIPLVAGWYLRGFGWIGAIGALAVAAVGAAVTRWFGPSLTSVRFALLATALLVFFRWAGL